MAAGNATEKSRQKIKDAVRSLENIQVSDLMKELSELNTRGYRLAQASLHCNDGSQEIGGSARKCLGGNRIRANLELRNSEA